MRAIRHHWCRIPLCLLLGLVSTVMVGLMGPWLGRLVYDDPLSSWLPGLSLGGGDTWAMEPPSSWSSRWCETITMRTAAARITFQNDSIIGFWDGPWPDDSFDDDPPDRTLVIIRSGWPWAALHGHRFRDDLPARSSTFSTLARFSPVTPIPAGLIGDLLVHAGLWSAMLVAGRRLWVQARRRISESGFRRALAGCVMVMFAGVVLTLIVAWSLERAPKLSATRWLPGNRGEGWVTLGQRQEMIRGGPETRLDRAAGWPFPAWRRSQTWNGARWKDGPSLQTRWGSLPVVPIWPRMMLDATLYA
ncbi:MAG: hypothetical protein KDA21_13940, partial [Phycisphaerales bacterium]|nr:hypothetical protein [Phycisphaerales bacterium]